jgi:hypothetical protein
VEAGKQNKIGSNKPNIGARGRGRPKGSPNKTTAAVKDMILQALGNKGGVKYLEKQADENPNAFLTLVGKVLPLDVNHAGGVTVQIVRLGE